MAAYPHTINCKWCGMATRHKGTKMCEGCWELSGRIEQDPVIARRMLEYVEAGPLGKAAIESTW